MNALIEPFFYCLLASMIWAPLVFLGATKIAGSDRNAGGVRSLSGLVWPAALILAALPVLTAPVAAALGLSLRTPAPLPPMAELAGAAVSVEAVPAAIVAEAAPHGATIADMLRAAAVIYFYSFVMLFVLAAVRHVWFAYRLNFAVPVDEPKLIDALEHWRQRIGVAVRPRYVFSHIVSSVCVYGFFRPVVVMPFNLLDRVSIEDAALMGAHEMAHVKRGDVLLFALCSAVKTVFWFNPFMHRICARATLAAEQGADALVLARGVSRRQYAQCFVQGLRLAAGAQKGFAGELIPSFTPFDKRSRRERLDAILTGAPEKPLIGLAGKIGLAASALAAAGLAFAQAAFAVTPPPPREALTVVPVAGEITFGYGKKAKVLGEDRPVHEGVDIRAKRGEPVRSAGDGKVIDATDRYRGGDAWGKVVVIDHGHGLVTRYAHLDSYVVRKGDNIDAGDVIGAVGSTGQATGPHLHFEVISDGEVIDPTPVVAPDATPPLAPASPVAPRSKEAAAAPRAEPAPLSPAAPLAPRSKATEKTTRKVRLAPLDAYRIDGDEEVREIDDKRARKLEKKMAQMQERLRDQFENFDAFNEWEDITVKFNDVELAGFEGGDELARMLDGQTFAMADLGDIKVVLPDMTRVLADARLSEEEIEIIRERHEDAVERAADAIEAARERMTDAEEARREAMAEAEEERREAIAEAEEARREAIAEKRESERERAQERRERERELDDARREREAALRDMRRDLERAQRKAEETEAETEWARQRMADTEELLKEREAAVREAQKSLEKELKEIERSRKELQAANSADQR